MTSVDLVQLSTKEILLLCSRVEQACVRHFESLSARLDGSDRDAARLLRRLADEEEAHRSQVERFDQATPFPVVWRLDERRVREAIDAHFPSLRAGLSSLPRRREPALRWASALEAEASRFYRLLAERARDPVSRAFFRRMALQEGRQSRRLKAGGSAAAGRAR